MSHFREASTLALALGLLAAAPAHAAEVRGTIVLPAESVRVPTLGYTRTRVAAPSALFRSPVGDAAVFLRVKESLPLPPPSAKWSVHFAGLRLTPAVMACAIDESLVITNDERSPITLVVGAETLQPIAPGASLTYLCQQAGWQKIRVNEWPHVRAELFVGEVGVVAAPGPDGKFTMTVPQGTYSLEVVTVDRGRLELPVTVAATNVDLGRLELGAGTRAPADGAVPGSPTPAGAAPASPEPTPAPASAAPTPAPASAAPASAAPAPATPRPTRAASPAASPAATPRPRPSKSPQAESGDEIQLEP